MRGLWIALVAGWLVAVFGCSSSEPPAPASLSVKVFLGSDDTTGFSQALNPVEFEFPRDHGAHPGFRNEWWYVTGNVEDPAGRRFGFQFTLFRNALSPEPPAHPSRWATNQAWLAHVAVTDAAAGKFYSDERFARGAVGLAGVDREPFTAWLEDWQMAAAPVDGCAPCFAVRLTAASDEFSLDLNLQSTRPAVMHGDSGLSPKSETPGNASYYYSFTRLQAEGSLTINDNNYRVRGDSWFDHEWSTSYLQKDRSGWDWFSVQLSDDSELMLYQLRHEQDSGQNYLSGTYIDTGGNSIILDRSDFTIRTTQTWTSPESGSVYPAAWDIAVPEPGLQITLTPIIPNQEQNASFRYWEGAVDASGVKLGHKITGRGYVELTGY
jgi:predicted secreted hydrolase